MADERDPRLARVLHHLLDDGRERARGSEAVAAGDRRLRREMLRKDVRRLLRADQRAGDDVVERDAQRLERSRLFAQRRNPFRGERTLRVVRIVIAAFGGDAVPDQVELERRHDQRAPDAARTGARRRARVIFSGRRLRGRAVSGTTRDATAAQTSSMAATLAR